MYDSMKMDFFWHHMRNDVYKKISIYRVCAMNRTSVKLKRHLQLFLASSKLQFSAIDNLLPLLCTIKRNQYDILITCRYSKLIRAMSTSGNSSNHVANVISDTRVAPFDISVYVLTVKEV